MSSAPLRLTADHMDDMIRTVSQHRAKLMKQGHVDHFGQPVRPQAQGAEPAPEPVTHDAYCVKCKAKKQIQTKAVHEHENGTHRAVGHCPTCGTETHKFMNAVDGTQLRASMESNRAATGGTA